MFFWEMCDWTSTSGLNGRGWALDCPSQHFILMGSADCSGVLRLQSSRAEVPNQYCGQSLEEPLISRFVQPDSILAKDRPIIGGPQMMESVHPDLSSSMLTGTETRNIPEETRPEPHEGKVGQISGRRRFRFFAEVRIMNHRFKIGDRVRWGNWHSGGFLSWKDRHCRRGKTP